MNSYEALREGAAWIDLSTRGKFRATGDDRARLLHAMSTNDVNRLEAGRGLYTFFLTAQGRIIADANIYNLGESLWLDTEPETGAKLLDHLDKYIIADDVTLADETEAWAVIGIEGPQSLALSANVGLTVPDSDFGITISGQSFVVRVSASGAPGFRVFIPLPGKEELISRLSMAGIPKASQEDLRMVRIENGVPRYGEDISERYLVQETQQLRAVSFNKGCYLGQEIVERVRSRGQVHRLLTPLRIRSTMTPPPGTKLRSGDKDMGEITSAVLSPTLGEVVALAYLRSESLQKGSELTVADGDGATAYVS
jgi:tRNA-modifying protein YgfZ